MYLADLMSYVLDAAENSEMRSSFRKLPGPEGVSFYLARSKATLENFELFALERSALLAASDMRVDKIQGFEAIAEKVFQEPRKLYFESSFSERNTIFSRVPMVKNAPELDMEIGAPTRVGSAIDIQGNGVATIQSCWNTSKSDLASYTTEMIRSFGIPKDHVKTVGKMASLNWSVFRVKIDINNKSTMTLPEFKESVERGDPETREFYDMFVADMARSGEKASMREAWYTYRLNKVCSYEFDRTGLNFLAEMAHITGEDVEKLADTLRADLDGEMVFGLAMVALLELGDLNVNVRPERSFPARGKNKGKKSPHRKVAMTNTAPTPRLGVVTLKLDKELVDALYRQRRDGIETQVPEDHQNEAGKRTAPVRHPVSGHLFLARNGQVVWRKAHWRGNDIRKRITRLS